MIVGFDVEWLFRELWRDVEIIYGEFLNEERDVKKEL